MVNRRHEAGYSVFVEFDIVHTSKGSICYLGICYLISVAFATIIQGMDLSLYLSSPSAPSVTHLRERMVELGYKVKSDAQIRQWHTRYKGRIPIPEYCVGLELATGGVVRRQDLRPDDWQRIWPELAPPVAAALLPASGTPEPSRQEVA